MEGLDSADKLKVEATLSALLENAGNMLTNIKL